jgi:hypothetical protein
VVVAVAVLRQMRSLLLQVVQVYQAVATVEMLLKILILAVLMHLQQLVQATVEEEAAVALFKLLTATATAVQELQLPGLLSIFTHDKKRG